MKLAMSLLNCFNYMEVNYDEGYTLFYIFILNNIISYWILCWGLRLSYMPRLGNLVVENMANCNSYSCSYFSCIWDNNWNIA